MYEESDQKTDLIFTYGILIIVGTESENPLSSHGVVPVARSPIDSENSGHRLITRCLQVECVLPAIQSSNMVKLQMLRGNQSRRPCRFSNRRVHLKWISITWAGE